MNHRIKRADKVMVGAESPRYIDAIITEKELIAPAVTPLVIMDLHGSWPQERSY